MLSIFPTQQIKSIGEWLIIPLMDWLLLTFLPLKKVYKSSNTAFAAANGQFMLFDKESYLLFGGHKKVKGKNVEDMEIARGFKQMRFKTLTLLGNNYVTCRMYHNIKEASDGFTKNFYPGFNINGIKFILLLSFFSFLFILPFLLIYLESIFISNCRHNIYRKNVYFIIIKAKIMDKYFIISAADDNINYYRH